MHSQWLLEVQWFNFSTSFRMNTGSGVQLYKTMQTIFSMNVHRITNARNDLNDNKFASKWRLGRLYSVMKAPMNLWKKWLSNSIDAIYLRWNRSDIVIVLCYYVHFLVLFHWKLNFIVNKRFLFCKSNSEKPNHINKLSKNFR